MDEKEKDVKLGGLLQLAFFVVGSPASLIIGYYADRVRRVRLFFWTTLIGEGPCMATYWVTSYWQLFALRAMTGIAVGDPCNGHGTCTLNGAGTEAICLCDEHYYGDSCEATCMAPNGQLCAGHGTCNWDNAEGLPKCTCEQHFVGQDCSIACPVGTTSSGAERVCSGYANECAIDTSGTKAVCSCPPGALGDACQFTCPGISASGLGNACHGNGVCRLVADSQGRPLAAMCTW